MEKKLLFLLNSIVSTLIDLCDFDLIWILEFNEKLKEIFESCSLKLKIKRDRTVYLIFKKTYNKFIFKKFKKNWGLSKTNVLIFEWMHRATPAFDYHTWIEDRQIKRDTSIANKTHV